MTSGSGCDGQKRGNSVTYFTFSQVIKWHTDMCDLPRSRIHLPSDVSRGICSSYSRVVVVNTEKIFSRSGRCMHNHDNAVQCRPLEFAKFTVFKKVTWINLCLVLLFVAVIPIKGSIIVFGIELQTDWQSVIENIYSWLIMLQLKFSLSSVGVMIFD